MHHLETCLLIAEVDRVLCHLVMFFIVFFYLMYKVKYTRYQDSSVNCGGGIKKKIGEGNNKIVGGGRREIKMKRSK